MDMRWRARCISFEINIVLVIIITIILYNEITYIKPIFEDSSNNTSTKLWIPLHTFTYIVLPTQECGETSERISIH